jgi:hypothetical protein
MWDLERLGAIAPKNISDLKDNLVNLSLVFLKEMLSTSLDPFIMFIIPFD